MFFLVVRRTRTLHLVVESGVACSLLQFRRNGRSMEWQSNHLPSVYCMVDGDMEVMPDKGHTRLPYYQERGHYYILLLRVYRLP